jgi:uncharacterized repeat protein (TIGR03803 family)
MLRFCRFHAMRGMPTGAVAALCPALLAAAPTLAAETTLYSLQCRPDAAEPFAGLAMNSAGVLFGTSFDGGTGSNGAAFVLTPPAQGTSAWAEQVVASLGGADTNPAANLIIGKSGVLYGTGLNGGTGGCDVKTFGCGGVFALTPPAKGRADWSTAYLHSFMGGADGSNPDGALVQDKHGNLYGTTEYGGPGDFGTVFELTPPTKKSGAWSESILYTFQNGNDGSLPASALLMDKTGALYGTTQYSNTNQNGVAFKLTPPATAGSAWGFATLAILPTAGGFQPSTSLVMGPRGVLYGTTAVGGDNYLGAIFSVVPPAAGQTQWTANTIYSFADEGDGAVPAGGLLYIGGSLYGATVGSGNPKSYGTVFKLSPPKLGSLGWSLKTMYRFTGGVDGAYPMGALVADSAKNLYGATMLGGTQKCGVVYEIPHS